MLISVYPLRKPGKTVLVILQINYFKQGFLRKLSFQLLSISTQITELTE